MSHPRMRTGAVCSLVANVQSISTRVRRVDPIPRGPDPTRPSVTAPYADGNVGEPGVAAGWMSKFICMGVQLTFQLRHFVVNP